MREMILAETTDDREKRPGQAPALPAGRLRRHLQGPQGPARPPSACSTRRSTSSSRTISRAQPTWPRSSASRSRRSVNRVHELHEFNPMLGFRGCRLGINYPEITAMQARAIFEAAADVHEGRHQGEARSDDPARRLQEGARPAGRHRPRRGRRRSRRRRRSSSPTRWAR